MKYHTANRLLFLFLLLLLTLPLFAQDDTGEDVITDLAYINSVTVNDDLTVDIVGELGDACTELGEITQEVEGTTITITIMTTRPADAICAMMLQTFETTIALDAAAITPGENLLLVNGNEYNVTLPAADDEECPVATDEMSLYRNEGASYCLLYPNQFTVEVIDDTTTVIATDAVGGASSVELVIATEAAGERTLEAIQSQRQVDAAEDNLSFEATTLGGQRAIVTEDIQARVANRTLITIYEDTVYTLTVWPIDDTFPDATALANELWESVQTSFTFVDDMPEMTQPQSETSITCDELLPDEGQEKFENAHFCFLHPATYGAIGNQTLVLLGGTELFNGRAVTFVVEVLPANNTTSLEDLQSDIIATYPEQELEFTEARLNTLEAITTDSIEIRRVGTRQLYVLWNDRIFKLQIDPLDAAYEEAAATVDALWDMVISTWIFKAE